MFLNKMNSIKTMFAEKKRIIVAFSGGVDSSVLASLAYEVLNKEALAITVNMQSLPFNEIDKTKKISKEIGIKHKIINFDEFKLQEFISNSPKRCYYCKQHILKILEKELITGNYNAIMEGTNISEMEGERPGMQAINEMKSIVISPFIQFNISKKEIRKMAKYLNLSVIDKSSSPCLATRIPYGQKITKVDIEKIKMAELYINSLGLSQVRVRYHKNIARIEVLTKSFDHILANREEIISHFKNLGFQYITLDLDGFRTGSLDEIL